MELLPVGNVTRECLIPVGFTEETITIQSPESMPLSVFLLVRLCVSTGAREALLTLFFEICVDTVGEAPVGLVGT